MYTVLCFHSQQYYCKSFKEENKNFSFFFHAFILGGFSFNHYALMSDTLVHSLLEPYNQKLIYFYTTEKGQSSRKCHWNAGNNEQKDQLFDWATYSRRPSEYKQPGDVVERSRWCLGQWRNIQLQSKNCKSFREDWYPNINCHMGYEKISLWLISY